MEVGYRRRRVDPRDALHERQGFYRRYLIRPARFVSTIGQRFQQLQQPLTLTANTPRPCASVTRVQALLAVLVIFSLQTQGFRNKELRPLLTQTLGLDDPQSITQAKMSYDLRRLRLHGLIQRIPGTHRYKLTTIGLRTALLYSRTFNRVIRPALSHLTAPNVSQQKSKLATAFHNLENQLTNYLPRKKLHEKT